VANRIGRTDITGFGTPYRGKVRDVYTLAPGLLGIVSSDRISAFDHILPELIPYKGQVLNTMAAFYFRQVEDIIETHVIDVPHPNVTIAKACVGVPIEVVVRGYLTGHAWRTYASGGRVLCGVPLPEGLRENERFASPLITPSTKATEGHDEDISEADLLAKGLVSPDVWSQIKDKALQLFQRGTEIAASRGLILVDTKYEFGLYEGRLVLMDEVHTPDSSRYFLSEGYSERLANGEKQAQLSKEFVREWLMANGFMGKEGQSMPDMPSDVVEMISLRYIDLYEKLTGTTFTPVPTDGFDATCGEIFRQAVTNRRA
jgi:phosphoribosylaminoimidazole-succinocarboxamide synthase